MTDVFEERGEYVSYLNRWLCCPECGSENVSDSIGYEGELKIKCRECKAWSSIAR